MAKTSALPPTCWAMVAAVVALVSFSLANWKGILITPDGWAYWQGAVSLIEGRGYAYFAGDPILAWPPLYSLYLALFILWFGPSGAALIVANAVLISVQAGLWCFVIVRGCSESGQPMRLSVLVSVTLYIGTLVAYVQQWVLADVLKYTLLPMLLASVWQVGKSDHPAHVVRWATAIALVSALLLLANNNSFAFVAAAAGLAGTQRRRGREAHAVAACLALCVACVIWFAVREVLGQDGSHTTGFGVGRYGPGEYLVQVVSGAGALLMPGWFQAPLTCGIFGALCIAVVAWRKSTPPFCRLCARFVLLSAVATYVLFNVVWVHDSLSDGRFVLFVPLIAVPLFMVWTESLPAKLRLGCLIVAVTPILITTTQMVYERRAAMHETVVGPSCSYIPSDAVLSSAMSGPPVAFEGGWRIAPARTCRIENGDEVMMWYPSPGKALTCW